MNAEGITKISDGDTRWNGREIEALAKALLTAIEALESIHRDCGDPAIESRCASALRQIRGEGEK